MKKDELGEYIRHWQSLYKTTEKDSLDIERDVWKTTGDEHFVHATNYFRLALEKSAGEETKVMDWQKPRQFHTDIAPSILETIKENEQYES